MKKISVLLAIVATLAGNGGYAQPAGRGAAAARQTANNEFAWGIGLVALAVLGTIVGVTASAASKDQSTFSH